MKTNREIYLAVCSLRDQAAGSARALEEYLRALLALAGQYGQRPDLDPSQFLKLLAGALVSDPLPFDPRWAAAYGRRDDASGAFEHWRRTVTEQVVDLREMETAGVFANELRYFGVSAPRGARWFNFDVGTYLECAAVGAFGGWEPNDPSGREFVPGKTAVQEPDGSVALHDPGDIARPIVAIERISWQAFTGFAECGQSYE
jgi:hypothetical protein